MATNPSGDPSPHVIRLQKHFRAMYNAKSKSFERMKSDEEFYFGDVEETGTQLNKKQLDAIENTYDIPISTKVAYAIGEQLLSFLTGGKPYPRIISPTDQLTQHAILYEQLLNAVWYESRMNLHLTNALRDAITTGQGWIHVRQNDFYSESTFNVIAEYVPWNQVYVDPTCQMADLSDADIVCIGRQVLRSKVEKQYGIKIRKEDLDYLGADGWDMGDDTGRYEYLYGFYGSSNEKEDKDKYVWVRDFYEKIEANVFVGVDSEGNMHVASERPRAYQAKNPKWVQLMGQIQSLEQAGQETSQAMQSHGEAVEEGENAMAEMGADPFKIASQMASEEMQMEQAGDVANQTAEQLQSLYTELEQTPEVVTLYDLRPIGSKDTVPVEQFFRRKQKSIRWTLLIGNRQIDRKVLPVDEFPLVPFTFSHFRSFNRTFGLVHYIKDVNKAMNKFWALSIYDMQVNATRKVLYAEGSIVDPVAVEQKWSQPTAWIGYTPQPNLPDGGRPTVIEGTQLNVATQQAIQGLTTLAEYITGIHALMQGQTSSATPDSFGGIQTIQTFGTSRSKLYSRNIEESLSVLSYVIVRYLQAYCDKDKVLQFFDENGDKAELQILSGAEDVRFRVRTNMTSNLPTARHMAAQILGIVSGQTKNPAVADLLTTALLKTADIPNGPQIAEQIDTVKQLNDQLAAAQKQMQDQEKQISQLNQQLFQKDISIAKEKAVGELKTQQALKEQELEAAASPEQLAKVDAGGDIETPPEEIPF